MESFPYDRWYLVGASWEKNTLLEYFDIFLGVVRSLPWGPRGLAVRHLPRMQEVVGSNHTEGKICFSHFTLFRVEYEELFCKTNIKYKNY